MQCKSYDVREPIMKDNLTPFQMKSFGIFYFYFRRDEFMMHERKRILNSCFDLKIEKIMMHDL